MADQIDIYSNIYTNPYFDVEAVVDDNEEEELDEDMEDELALFLDDSETIEDSSSELFRSSAPPEETSGDEEEIAREIRQRHAKENTPPSTVDAVKGEALFSLAVKPNREKDAVVELQRIIDHRRKNLKTITLSSVASYGQYPGQVFVWAIGAQELKRISTTRSYMLHWKIAHIEQSEWLRLYAALDDHFRIPVPCWIRIKTGLYRGDLALLERTYSNECCDVLLIPRAFLIGRKRPKPALLTSEIATRYWGDKSLKSDLSRQDWFIAKKMEIKAGLLCRYISCHSFTPGLPKDLDELSPFMGAVPMLGNPDLLAFVLKTMDDIRENDLVTVFRVGDRVRVVSGSFSTMEGIVRALEDGHASISLTSSHPNVHVPPLAIMPVSDLRRLFKEGDTIRVISGFQKGRKGCIVHVDGITLTFLDIENRPRTEMVHSSGEHASPPPPQVSVYSFEVEFCSTEIEWKQASTSSGDIEFPESIGQRVEISAGIYKGSRGYIEGWDTSISKTNPHILVNLYFKASTECPSLDSQTHNPLALLGKIRVLPNVIRRCFVNGDIVIRSGIPHVRFIVHPPIINDDDDDVPASSAKQPVDPNEISLVNAVFDSTQKEWVLPTENPTWCLVPRQDLIMTETIHDPILAIDAGHVWFKENMTVVVIKGSRKGYRGRVRKVLRADVQVELEATQKVHKYKPKQLARLIDDTLVRRPPTPSPDTSPIAASSTNLPEVEDAQPSFDHLQLLASFQAGFTPMPTPMDHPEPAWDPLSRTPRRRVEYDIYGSLFLLHLPFSRVYDQIALMFYVRGTVGTFMNGQYEGNLVRTAPASKRPETMTQHGDVYVYMTYRPSSLTAIHCRYLIPAHPGPGDVGALLFSADAGCIVDVTEKRFDDPNCVLVRTREYPPREFKLDVCDMIRVFE